MADFVKPIRKTVEIKDAFAELLGKTLIKDLHDNEEICPICHGTGLCIRDNPYGLSNDPEKKFNQFPYKHQSITSCPNCYNGVVRYCPDCGKQLSRMRTICDCEAAQQRRQQEEDRKEQELFDKTEKHEPNALGDKFLMAQSDFYPYNDGYFVSWDDFFDNLDADIAERPIYVWGTSEIELSLDATDIVSTACEDMYDDAYSDIGDAAVKEMQDFLDAWKEKYGVRSYSVTTKHAIRIPWESRE